MVLQEFFRRVSRMASMRFSATTIKAQVEGASTGGWRPAFC